MGTHIKPLLGIGCLIVSLATTGCGPAVDSDPGQDGTTDTATAQNLKEATTAGSVSPVVTTVDSHATLLAGHVLYTVAELFSAPVVDLIVEGTVERIEYRLLDGLAPMTVMTISVERASSDAGPEVTVLESGGFIPVSEHSKGDRERFSTDSSQNDRPDNGVVDYLPFGNAPHPQVGDQVVLFLWENPPNGGDIPGTYFEVGDAFGRFTLKADGGYERAGHESGYERTLTQEQLNEGFQITE